MEYNMK